MQAVRPPSVRSPRTFYDIFGVAVVIVGVLTVMTTVSGGAQPGYEVVLVFGSFLLWAVWAVQRILERTVPDVDQLSP